MAIITTEPATPDRWSDAVETLTGGGDGSTCWCQWWYLPNKDWNETPVDARKEKLHTQITEGPPRALLAYVDGDAAGWCRVAPRVEQARLLRSKVVGASNVPADDPTAWAITCLVVRKEHRRAGVGRAMIEAAAQFAGANGATSVEGYPVDLDKTAKKSSNALYHGTLDMFLDAGFRETARSSPGRPTVRLDLALL